MDYLRKPVPADIRFQAEIVLGEAALEIPAFAKAAEADLIVMATHGYGGWRHACLGSVTEIVVRNAPCPVPSIGPNCRAPMEASLADANLNSTRHASGW